MNNLIEVKPEKGEFRINVILEGKLQRTAWKMDQRGAEMVAKEFSEYYGKGESLEIKRVN